MKRYWLSILILAVIGIVFPVVITGQSLLPLLDLPSFIITVVTPFFFVSILFGFKEMRRAFSIIRKKEIEHDSLMSALAFFKVYGRATWFSAIIGAFAGGIGMVANWEDKASMGPNLALTLLTLFYCGLVQLAIVIPYTIFIHKQLGNNRIRGDIFSIFGSLFGVCFAALLLFALFVPDFLQLSEQKQNQVDLIEIFNGIRDKADIEGYGMLEYELYNVSGNESSDFYEFIRIYTQMQKEYVFFPYYWNTNYWIEGNTVLNENVKTLMVNHNRNLSITRLLKPYGVTIFMFNYLNSNGKYEFFSIEASKSKKLETLLSDNNDFRENTPDGGFIVEMGGDDEKGL